MELIVKERLRLMNVMTAGEDHIVVLRAIRDLKSKVGFTAEEIQEYGFEDTSDGKTRWNPNVPQGKDIDLSKAEVAMITTKLQELEQKGKLTEDDISIYEKFVEGGA